MMTSSILFLFFGRKFYTLLLVLLGFGFLFSRAIGLEDLFDGFF